MTIAANVAAVWRRIAVFIEAIEQVEIDPLDEQQRRIASLEKRIAMIEAANNERRRNC